MKSYPSHKICWAENLKMFCFDKINMKNIKAISQICSLHEKCPNTEFFLVRIFLYFDWIRRFSVNLRILSECRKIRTRKNSDFWTLLTQCFLKWSNSKIRMKSVALIWYLCNELWEKTGHSLCAFIIKFE